VHKSTWLHLRIPFSLYLMPVFTFAASQYPFADIKSLVISFVAIHLFLYPAINGYNSYFDKDTESIGGLKHPPPVRLELYYYSLAFDVVALILGLIISWQFALMLFIYGLISKAYSHPWTRLKRHGLMALVIVALFQGGFAYLMSTLALHHLEFNQLYDKKILAPAGLCTAMMLGFYPITQIYQHKEDRKRGDLTASMVLGLNGTFIFSAIVFLLANVGFYFYFINFFHRVIFFILFQVFLSPLFAFFLLWYFAFLVDRSEANFRNTMMLNKIASACLMAFFIGMAIIENWF
jgi:hypothetical protein